MGCVPFVDTFDIFPTLRAEGLGEILGPQFQREYHHKIRCGGLVTTSEESPTGLVQSCLHLMRETVSCSGGPSPERHVRISCVFPVAA